MTCNRCGKRLSWVALDGCGVGTPDNRVPVYERKGSVIIEAPAWLDGMAARVLCPYCYQSPMGEGDMEICIGQSDEIFVKIQVREGPRYDAYGRYSRSQRV